MTVPESILVDILNKGLAFIRKNYNDQTDKNKSYLYKITHGVNIEKYNYYDQALQVFINNDQKSQRYLDANLIFNMMPQKFPSMYVTMPSEQGQTGGNGMGMDEGYVEADIIQPVYEEEVLQTPGSQTPIYTRRYQTTLGIIIYSDNSNEVQLIYHVIKTLLISISSIIHLSGLESPQLSGMDLTNYSALAEKNVFMRGLNVAVQYETSAPAINSLETAHSLTATGSIVNE